MARATILGNALFPNIAGRMMKVINTVLPRPGGPDGDAPRSGWELSRPE
jgi:hypothetical protein